MTNQLASINHIVVLALENRSFDQMLGFLYTDQNNVSPAGQPFEGLTGQETNPDANGNPVQVFRITADMPNAYFMPGCDPGEAYAQVNQQLFGSLDAPTPPVATNQGFLINFANNLPSRTASRFYGALPGTVANNIMGMFTPQMLPILSGLAKGFAVCDHWFASAPTETMPNRAFMCAATSQGKLGDTNVTPFTAPSIFGALTTAGQPWAVYGYNAKPYTQSDFNDTLSAPPSNFGEWSDFQAAAQAGSLGAYTFLEPSWGRSGNSQHPNYDVSLGEQLIHDVYYTLRSGPNWNQTLLIITYDEHGGNYDHVPPPTGATPPDNSVGDQGFDFTRFGVRVPAVLVSPLIAQGTVFRAPSGGPPFDHTSILKTVEVRFGLQPLTARDAAAADLGDVLTLAAPRTDDPIAGVAPPTSTGATPNAELPSHLQMVRAATVASLPIVNAHGVSDHVMPDLATGADHEAYIQARMTAWNNRSAATKAPPTAAH